jgi:hypothetical protein
MGFFDRLKADKQSIDQAREVMSQPGFADMVRQGQEAAAQMQASGQMQHLMADAQRASTLVTSGVSTTATVKSVERIAGAPSGGGSAVPGWGPAGEAPSPAVNAMMPTEMKITVEVQPEGKAAYEGSFTQALPEQLGSSIAPGTRIIVRVDPNDPSSMMWWGAAP